MERDRRGCEKYKKGVTREGVSKKKAREMCKRSDEGGINVTHLKQKIF